MQCAACLYQDASIPVKPSVCLWKMRTHRSRYLEIFSGVKIADAGGKKGWAKSLRLGHPLAFLSIKIKNAIRAIN